MTRITTLLFLFCWTLSFKISGQNDPLYNQYQMNQLLINPAYAGVNDRMTATWISRVQWAGVTGAPVTNSASIHSALNWLNMGLGLAVVNDRLGINNNNEVNVMYSYRLDFGATKLQFGLQGGLVNFNYDYSKLNLEYLDDPNLQMQQQKFTKPNIGSGIFYYGSNIGFGEFLLLHLEVRIV